MLCKTSVKLYKSSNKNSSISIRVSIRKKTNISFPFTFAFKALLKSQTAFFQVLFFNPVNQTGANNIYLIPPIFTLTKREGNCYFLHQWMEKSLCACFTASSMHCLPSAELSLRLCFNLFKVFCGNLVSHTHYTCLYLPLNVVARMSAVFVI